jgi:hypothetical protein
MHHDGRPAIFSCTRTSSSFRDASRVRACDGRRNLERQSFIHVQRDTTCSSKAEVGKDPLCVMLADAGTEKSMRERRRSRASIGARERKERRASLRIIHGEARMDERDCGFGEGVEATVCRISPIWRGR